MLLRCVLLLLALPAFAQQPSHDIARKEGGRRAAETYFHEQRAYPYGRVPQTARLDAIEQARSLLPLRSRGLHAAQSWQPIGPYNVGGRVNSVAVHPTDPDIVWIGAADGGVWKSTNGGLAWRSVMDDANSLALGAIAVSPDDPNLLFAGTGEAAFNIDTYSGAGIYKSTDGGETWRSSGLTTVASFSRIVILPGTATILAAAVRNNGGIYRSSDGGATWSRRFPHGIFDLTVNPQNSDEIWAGGGEHGVHRSTDGGLTFVPSGEGIAADGAFPNRVSVQVAPGDPSRLYALASEYLPPSSEISRIYTSTDGGTTWQLRLDNQPNLLNYYGFSQGTYNNVIAVSPVDPDVAFAGGVILMRTVDGGATWHQVAHDVHVDYHALAFAPSGDNRLYVGNDGGMYRADLAGSQFERICRGLAITQFYGMGVDQRAADVTYGGTQDNGTIATTAELYNLDDPGLISGSDGFDVAIDHTNSDIVYVEHPYGEPFRVDLRTRSSLRIATGLDMREQAAWSAPLLMNPLDARVLYLGRTRVYRFDARTSIWRPISPLMRSTLFAIGVSPIDTALIYAGTGRGELQMTTDAGATWRELSIGRGLPDRAVTDITPSPLDRCTAFITYSGFHTGHVFRTTDCGETWQDVSSGLPDIPCNAIVADSADPDVLFVGTDIGVFATTDGGVTWGPLGSGMPAVVVVDLAMHEASRTLRAATHGRSMYEISVGDVTVERAIVSPAGGERAVGTSMQSVVWSGIEDAVSLELSLDDGATWGPLASSIVGGAYLWRVPDTPSTVARLRATSAADPGVRAISGSFTIEKLRPGIVIGTALKPVNAFGLAFDGTSLWATSEWGDTLVKIDPTSLATVDFVRVRGLSPGERLSDIAYHPGRGTLLIHAADDPYPSERGHGFLLEVDRDGTVVDRWVSPCTLPVGLAVVEDPIAGLSILASDLLSDQAVYLIDDETGETIRQIPRLETIDLGPVGMTSDAVPGSFWQVIADFSFEEGPRGSTAVRMTLDNLRPTCVFGLMTSADSTPVIGEWNWGRLHARGIERDPRDESFWVTNIDGTIFKVTGCVGEVSSARSDDAHEARLDVELAPNPAHETTRVTVRLASPSNLRLELYDARGALVRTIDRGRIEAGEHETMFDLAGIASGVYALDVIAGSARDTWRVVVIE